MAVSISGLIAPWSDHFAPDEFACRHCGLAVAHSELLHALEQLRAAVGRPLVIRSGFRCPPHNRDVGGVSNSQHLYGTAVDLVTDVPWEVVAALGQFSGIGRTGGSATHVDVRHVVQHTNPTNSSPSNPALWDY